MKEPCAQQVPASVNFPLIKIKGEFDSPSQTQGQFPFEVPAVMTLQPDDNRTGRDVSEQKNAVSDRFPDLFLA